MSDPILLARRDAIECLLLPALAVLGVGAERESQSKRNQGEQFVHGVSSRRGDKGESRPGFMHTTLLVAISPTGGP